MVDFEIKLQYNKKEQCLTVNYEENTINFKDVKSAEDVGDAIESFIGLYDICELGDDN